MATAIEQIDPDLQYAKQRLDAWGYWLRATHESRLLFKNKCPFVVAPSGTTEYDDPEAEEIEALLASMMNNKARVTQYLVLVQEYYFQATVRDGRLRVRDVKGRALSMQGYMNERDRGENYIAGVLSGRKP